MRTLLTFSSLVLIHQLKTRGQLSSLEPGLLTSTIPVLGLQLKTRGQLSSPEPGLLSPQLLNTSPNPLAQDQSPAFKPGPVSSRPVLILRLKLRGRLQLSSIEPGLRTSSAPVLIPRLVTRGQFHSLTESCLFASSPPVSYMQLFSLESGSITPHHQHYSSPQAQDQSTALQPGSWYPHLLTSSTPHHQSSPPAQGQRPAL